MFPLFLPVAQLAEQPSCKRRREDPLTWSFAVEPSRFRHVLGSGQEPALRVQRYGRPVQVPVWWSAVLPRSFCDDPGRPGTGMVRRNRHREPVVRAFARGDVL